MNPVQQRCEKAGTDDSAFPPSASHYAEGPEKLLKIFNQTISEMEKNIKNSGRAFLWIPAITIAITVISAATYAQDGNAGINQANTQVRSYFESGTSLMYAIGAILGLIGAVKVYSKWNSGDQDTSKVAAAWFGSCIFLVVVATIIKSFFGL